MDTPFPSVPAHTLQAKGYPDVASRVFLRRVADQAPHVPMFALVDLDPDGIAILSTYKYGSYRLAHEKVTPQDTPGLNLPDMQWLGVKRHHISRTPVGEGSTCTDTNAMRELQGIMRLTARDRTRAMRMLEWDLCGDGGLDELPDGLVSWVSSELDTTCTQSWGLSMDRPGSDDGMLF
jgi:meiotic recombination protein SPO11